ncbi:MAG: hypothetical protein U0269_16510 [Polyangiales bacterium]
MQTRDSQFVRDALKRALWLALAVAPAACGAVVSPEDGGRTDSGGTDAVQTCFDPQTNRTLRVGETNGLRCPCICTVTGMQCASCPVPLCMMSDGRYLQEGQSAIAPDGCNTCTCGPNTQLSCTEIACPDVRTDDASADAASCVAQVRYTVPNCEAQITYPCGIPGGPLVGGNDPRCASLCSPVGNIGIQPGYCIAVGGANTVQCGVCGVGRFTDGLGLDDCDWEDRDTFAGWLARGATVERIAATAFDRLADELAALGAPSFLVQTARESAEHERGHFDALAFFARREGVEPKVSGAAALRSRSLFEIALENAGEGCVRETLGAVVMDYQARHADDPALREALAKIADEESMHSAWSWALDHWARTVLDAPSVAQLDRARDRAIAELAHSMGAQDPSPELAARAGMPSAAVVRAMIEGLRESLWTVN